MTRPRFASPTRLAALLVTLACASHSSEARLPAWADAIAEQAPAIPEGVSKLPSRVLLHERTIVVGTDGVMKESLHIANQSLSQSNDRAGLEAQWFSRNTKIKTSKGWHQPPKGGTERASASDSVDIALNSAFLSDSKARIMAFDELKRGSLVFFEFEMITQPFTLGFDESFQAGVNIDLQRVSLSVPAGWDVIYDWLGAAGTAPTVSGNTYVWELRDIAALDLADRSAAMSADRGAHLVVSIVPPDGSSPVPGFRRWTDLAAWYQTKSAGLTAIAALPPSLNGTSSVPLSIRCANYVRDQVRYVAKEVGIGGYIPRPAKETSETLWGDCKDKATLLSGLLATQEIESYPMLVNASVHHTVSEIVPALSSFDHVVSAVRVDEALAPLADGWPALFDVPGLGRMLLIDSTDEVNPVGWVSAALAGKRALLIAPQASQLVTLPGQTASAHRVERELTVTLDADGRAAFHRDTHYYGDPGRVIRRTCRESPKEREKSILKGVRDEWVEAVPSGYEVELETKEGAMREIFDWTVSELPQSGGRRIASVFEGVRAWLPAVPLSKRKVAVVFDHPMTLNFRAIVKGVPSGFRPPDAKSFAGDGWSVTTEFNVNGEELKATLQVTLEKTAFEASEFDSLKKFYSALTVTTAGVFL